MTRNRALLIAAMSCGTFHPDAQACQAPVPVTPPVQVSAPPPRTRNPLLVLKAMAVAIMRCLN